MIKKINIEIEHLKKSYDKEVLKDINLKINNTSFIAIIGKSGSGKSTLMNILGLIESYDEGIYKLNDLIIKNQKDYAKIRGSYIGFIFQNYNLISTLSCIENVLMPLEYRKNSDEIQENFLEALNIGDLVNKPITVLSGGEKQRIAIARALIRNPSLIIADEPTGNLDPVNTENVLKILENENKKGRAVIMITHDINVAQRANKIYALEKGVLVEKK